VCCGWMNGVEVLTSIHDSSRSSLGASMPVSTRRCGARSGQAAEEVEGSLLVTETWMYEGVMERDVMKVAASWWAGSQSRE
jgi:hypothetical protein